MDLGVIYDWVFQEALFDDDDDDAADADDSSGEVKSTPSAPLMLRKVFTYVPPPMSLSSAIGMVSQPADTSVAIDKSIITPPHVFLEIATAGSDKLDFVNVSEIDYITGVEPDKHSLSRLVKHTDFKFEFLNETCRVIVLDTMLAFVFDGSLDEPQMMLKGGKGVTFSLFADRDCKTSGHHVVRNLCWIVRTRVVGKTRRIDLHVLMIDEKSEMKLKELGRKRKVEALAKITKQQIVSLSSQDVQEEEQKTARKRRRRRAPSGFDGLEANRRRKKRVVGPGFGLIQSEVDICISGARQTVDFR